MFIPSTFWNNQSQSWRIGSLKLKQLMNQNQKKLLQGMQDNYAIHFYKVEEKHCVYSILPNMGFAACFSMYYSKHLQYAVMHGVSHIPAQKRKLVVITALLMCHLMQIALRSNNCKAQEAVASAG